MYISIAGVFLVLSGCASFGAAQIQSLDGLFNVTSPIESGSYVAGQKLPVTYIILQETTSLKMNIFLQAVGMNFTTTTIALNADVSQEVSSIVTVNQKTFWQHSYNYDIPQISPAGAYKVVFQSVNTNVNTSVGINLNPFISSSLTPPSSTQASSAASASSSTGSSSSNSSRTANDSQRISGNIGFVAAVLATGLFFITTF
ncbi:hypothetical protein J3Q64DRAFT_1193838 [Phycomyces blakesleeanus]|uniref:Secreted protein n=2 Tax=Phycomyces blakesleeanus TaxID=4837 RepID=A0A163BGA9_PHYB8|nr:hypothetical protein PHYBLDRAFT_71323 [Phycomyces blakesleeanus NRRL 1555(-)]OAD81401.1 hypothetical protein PHYBLDRAFT_71323 [Phycomyces blakesleeanus NRRL 1555(-)]|eukprot:XP_018299441.1 hypothetical protein PHYBLDRAFT_71323 [Phycomyces blakesleeanus NRRL 1555(-)]